MTDRRGFVLEIIGYGDSARATRFNQSLAQLRAEAVQRYLADKDNVPLMRMFAVGFGAARPSMQNASTGATGTSTSGITSTQTLPRRVEIRLLTNAAVEGTPTKTSGAN